MFPEDPWKLAACTRDLSLQVDNTTDTSTCIQPARPERKQTRGLDEAGGNLGRRAVNDALLALFDGLSTAGSGEGGDDHQGVSRPQTWLPLLDEGRSETLPENPPLLHVEGVRSPDIQLLGHLGPGEGGLHGSLRPRALDLDGLGNRQVNVVEDIELDAFGLPAQINSVYNETTNPLGPRPLLAGKYRVGWLPGYDRSGPPRTLLSRFRKKATPKETIIKDLPDEPVAKQILTKTYVVPEPRADLLEPTNWRDGLFGTKKPFKTSKLVPAHLRIPEGEAGRLYYTLALLTEGMTRDSEFRMFIRNKLRTLREQDDVWKELSSQEFYSLSCQAVPALMIQTPMDNQIEDVLRAYGPITIQRNNLLARGAIIAEPTWTQRLLRPLFPRWVERSRLAQPVQVLPAAL